MKAAGLNVPLMGGDGIYDPAYIELAGKTSEGDLATSVGAPTETLRLGQGIRRRLRGRRLLRAVRGLRCATPTTPPTRSSTALKVSLARTPRTPSRARQATVDAIGKVSFDGATGKVAFDEYGDTTTKVLTVYKVERRQVGRRPRPAVQ